MRWLPVKRYIATIAVTVFMILAVYITLLKGEIPEQMIPIVSLIVGYYFGAGKTSKEE
jgi:hypothetical protein